MAHFRWGIFGTGFIAKRFAYALRHLPDAEISAIGSRRPANARLFAQGIGSNAFAGSYEEVSQMTDIDAVYIATPPSIHLQQALMCIMADKPVLVEKPFACSADEAKKIREAAKSRDVFCMEAMWTRFLPLLHQVKEMVDKGRLGKIRLLTNRPRSIVGLEGYGLEVVEQQLVASERKL